jgi:hypothetical protein
MLLTAKLNPDERNLVKKDEIGEAVSPPRAPDLDSMLPDVPALADGLDLYSERKETTTLTGAETAPEKLQARKQKILGMRHRKRQQSLAQKQQHQRHRALIDILGARSDTDLGQGLIGDPDDDTDITGVAGEGTSAAAALVSSPSEQHSSPATGTLTGALPQDNKQLTVASTGLSSSSSVLPSQANTDTCTTPAANQDSMELQRHKEEARLTANYLDSLLEDTDSD